MRNNRIVVIEDDSLLSQTIRMCLTKRGHEVKTFGNGVDAARHLMEEKPDLVVLDIRLPDCDGWFLASLLRKDTQAGRTPIVVISALEPDRSRMADTKPYAFIQKPFDMAQLVQTVEKGLKEETLTAA
ncbi:MAG: response regulator [Chloroflexota bacterium]